MSLAIARIISNLGDRATRGRAAKSRRRIARFNLSSHNGIQSPGVGNAIAERFVNEVNLDHCTFRLVAALCRCSRTTACANDSAAELSIGGLTFKKTNSVSIESEELKITLETVTVRYQFLNQSPNP